MASAGLLALLDDIATLLDDVAILTKVAAKKTAGVLGDDLALNAEQVSGVRAERELPVVWAVAKGSAKNKLILVPCALLLSAFVPWMITPLLMLGGAFLCFEGFEKIAHALFHKAQVQAHKEKIKHVLLDSQSDLLAFEQEKIKGAIRTDFILSAEIVVIVLGTVKDASMAQQIGVVSVIAIAITVGVYGLVAAIVKLDDAGLYLMRLPAERLWQKIRHQLGQFILSACPYFMKSLALLGTAAMFIVGGGILVHGLPFMHDVLHHLHTVSAIKVMPEFLVDSIFNALVGIVAGALLVASLTLGQRLKAIVLPR